MSLFNSIHSVFQVFAILIVLFQYLPSLNPMIIHLKILLLLSPRCLCKLTIHIFHPIKDSVCSQRLTLKLCTHYINRVINFVLPLYHFHHLILANHLFRQKIGNFKVIELLLNKIMDTFSDLSNYDGFDLILDILPMQGYILFGLFYIPAYFICLVLEILSCLIDLSVEMLI